MNKNCQHISRTYTVYIINELEHVHIPILACPSCRLSQHLLKLVEEVYQTNCVFFCITFVPDIYTFVK